MDEFELKRLEFPSSELELFCRDASLIKFYSPASMASQLPLKPNMAVICVREVVKIFHRDRSETLKQQHPNHEDTPYLTVSLTLSFILHLFI